MNPKAAPFISGDMRVSLDIRERNVEVPRLLELEHALEPRHPQRKAGSPKRSMARVAVYQAIKAAGEYCCAPVPALAHMAGCSVRECQYAIADLVFLGWVKKLADVGRLGGAGTGAQKQGNLYTVTRPSWAWDGTHRKRLWSLARQTGVPVHSMHPSVREALGVQEGHEALPQKAKPELKKRTGAQHAPVGPVHRAKTPLLLINKGHQKEKGKRTTGGRVEWPADGVGFLDAWKGRYKRGPFPDAKALEAYQEIRVGAGGARAAEELAKAFIGSEDAWLIDRGHPLAYLRKHWPALQARLPKATKARVVVQAACEDILSRMTGSQRKS